MNLLTASYLLAFASHRSGGLLESLFRAMLHGFAWHIGGRIVSRLPFGVVVVIAIVLIVIGLYMWLHNRHSDE